MKIKFWGTRGSLPYCGQNNIKDRIEFALKNTDFKSLKESRSIKEFIDQLPEEVIFSAGGSTPCIEIAGGNDIIVLDAGTGIRNLGNDIIKKRKLTSGRVHLFLTHFHWDHIQGFPFFKPAYMPGFEIIIYSFQPEAQQVLTQQQNSLNFPHSFEELKSLIRFEQLSENDVIRINGIELCGIRQNHPGDSYCYCIQSSGKKLVYSTDNEFTDEVVNKRAYLKFISGADVLIFDGQYEQDEYSERKKNWGHSSNEIAVKLAIQANIKTMYLFHHKHDISDAGLYKFYQNTLKIKERLFPCKDLEIKLSYDNCMFSL